MLQELQYNNIILSQEERVKFNDLADEMIATFSESIDGMYKISREYTDMNNIHHRVSKIMCDVSVFVSYAFADCVVLTKLFVNTSVAYEKSLLRGKLKVHLNECFKKLYGFTNQSKKVSYVAKLKEIMPLFHGPDREFARILDDLEEKQEGVPFNISLGGGTQGLAEVVYLNYLRLPEYILPLEKEFGGSFIGWIKSFKFYTCPLNYYEIRQNYNFNKII